MKKIPRWVSLLLALVMLALVPAEQVFALTFNTQIIDVEYETPTKITAVEQQESQFIISTETGRGRVNNFYLTFPTDGGIRFRADEEGIFKPEAVSKIEYSGEETYDGEKAVVMQANGTKAKVYHESAPWRMEIYNSDDTKVAEYRADSIWLGYDESNALRKVKIASALHEDETMFGLGERFNGFVQNGKTVEMWNADCLKQLSKSYGDHNVGYKNIPLLHSNNGYSVFHNNTYYGIADVGESNAKEYSFEFYGPILDMYIWTGTSAENISQYHALTGSSVKVPKWALSYWAGQASRVWLSEGTEVEKVHDTVFSRLEKYNELNTPIKNIYAEGIAVKKDYISIIEEMNSLGIRSFGWMDSTYRTHDSAVSASKIAEDALKASKNMPLVQWNDAKRADWWTSDGAKWVDYTAPLSIDWVRERFSPYLGKGLYGMMVDYNDAVALGTYYPGNGGTGDWMHNFSCYYYNQAVNEVFKEYYGEGEYINFARAACAGSQQFTAVFAGDQTADFMGLQQVVSGLLSSASSGIPIWGSDIGGMEKSETASKYEPEVYARWLALGTFSPLMRSHAQRGWVDPWEYDKNGFCTELFQKYYWTRENIVDLVYSGTIKANKENVPMTQAMVVAYPQQKKLASNSTQYLFCDQLLVCPVVEESVASIDVQFPEGRWVNLWDGRVYEGGQTVNVDAPMDVTPVYVKEGAAFPVTYGEELDIGTVNTVGKNVNALVVTPAKAKQENTYYVDEENTKTVVCDSNGEKSYTVSSETAMDKPIVVAMGALADVVSVDGKKLQELSVEPTSVATEIGYYRDIENNSTIVVTGGEWNRIEYNDTEEGLVNYALNRVVSTEGLDEDDDAKRQNVVDGSYNTALVLNESKKTSIVLDLEEKREIKKILVNWTGHYAKSYVMEASIDGKNWTPIYEKEKGGGGCDTILLEEGEYRYLRLSGFKKAGRRNPELAEIEVYGDETYYLADGQPGMKLAGKLENGFFYRLLESWPVIVFIIAAVIVLTVCIILMIRKKRVKK